MDEILEQIESTVQRIYATHPSLGVAPKSPVEVAGLTRITEGWETEVFAFTVKATRVDGRPFVHELILRLYQGAGDTTKARREFSALEHLYGIGYPVPQPLFLEPMNALMGRPYMIMERIPGRSLGALLSRADGSARTTLLEQFCALLYDLHQRDCRGFPGSASLARGQSTAMAVRAALRQWEARLAKAGITGFAVAFAWLRDHLSGEPISTPAAVHLDYHPHNVLVRDDGAAFVIDWTNATVSDYRLDLGWTWMLLESHAGREISQHLLTAYERLAGHKVEAMPLFEVAACLRRLGTIVVALKKGPAELGMRAGAEGLISDFGHISRVYELLQERADVAISDVEDLLASLT